MRSLLIIVSAACLTTSVWCVEKAPEPAPAPIPVPTTLECPESVIEDADGSLYCSNLGGSEVTLEDAVYKDKNGFIAKLKPDGSVETVKFLPLDGQPPLHAPKGMVILGSTLWVADVDRVVAFDLKTRKQTSEIDLRPSQVRFANDLVAAGPQGPLLCSDTSYDQLLLIDISGAKTTDRVRVLSKWTFGGNEKKKLGAINGLWMTGQSPTRTLYVAGFPLAAAVPDGEEPSGTIQTYDLDDQYALTNPQKLPFAPGLWDGIAVHADGIVYASDWASGSLCSLTTKVAPKVESTDEQTTLRNIPPSKPIQLADDLETPADFCVLKDGSAVLVPEMAANRVTRIDLN
jgi:hypothetical protein